MPAITPCLRGATFVVLLAAPLLVANAEEGRRGPGAPDPNDPVLPPRKALVQAPARARPAAPLQLRSRPAADPAKTQYFTDAGLERPVLEPTDRERAKLEAARVRVAASRAAGTLQASPFRAARALPPLHEIEAGKLERLRAAKPAPVTSAPEAMGLPAEPRSRQLQGPAGITPAERAKLEAKPASSVTPETQKEESR